MPNKLTSIYDLPSKILKKMGILKSEKYLNQTRFKPFDLQLRI